MDAPTDQSTPTVAQRIPPGPVRRARRRRPTGAPPPLPHHLQTSGFGWLIVAVALVALTIAVFARGLRGLAVEVTVADDAVVRWLAGLHAPGLVGVWRALAALSSWWVLNGALVGWGVALLVLRRFRHLIIVLILVQLVSLVVEDWVGPIVQRPRPFGVVIRTGWGGWALPSIQVAYFAFGLVVILYALVPEGRWRNVGKTVAAVLVALTALGRIGLGADTPTGVLVGAAIGVAIPLVVFRLFAPSAVFPVAYRRGRSAHLDVGGARGVAIRRALEDQLGLVVEELRPFGLSGSAGSTPLRITVKGDPPTHLFGKLYARSHLRADRWYKLGRELLYGRLEDEKPFNTVRRLVQQEDYALRLCRAAGLPSPVPYGFVELTPEREYLLVTEFFDGAVELGEAQVDGEIIDDGLGIIRRLWEAGLAHRDIKPANLLVRDRHLLLIDVAFVEARPSPPQPIRVQRWSARRIGLLALVAVLLAFLGNTITRGVTSNEATRTPLYIGNLACTDLEPLWLEAQSVPSASLVPCLRPIPAGWKLMNLTVNDGRSVLTFDSDRAGTGAMVARLTASCPFGRGTEVASDHAEVRRYMLIEQQAPRFVATRYDVFVGGGCVTTRFTLPAETRAQLIAEAVTLLDFTTRQALRQALSQRSHGRLHLDPVESR
jgi:membrane-associated phospholipid phosphatase